MNFEDKLTVTTSDWSLGDVICSTPSPVKNYLIIASEGTSPTTYYMVDVATTKIFLSATSLSGSPTSLREKFIAGGYTITKIIPASQLTLVADE